jgi:hypothetical protein
MKHAVVAAWIFANLAKPFLFNTARMVLLSSTGF